MIKRLFSTLGLWSLVIILPVLFGPQGGVWFLALLTVLTQYELYTLLQKTGFRPQRRLGCFFGLIIILGTWYMPHFEGMNSFNSGTDLFAFAVIVISLTVLRYPNFTEAKRNIMPTLLGLLLVPFMLHFYVRLVVHYEKLGFPLTGLLLTLWLIAVAKFSDIGGLILGTSFGRHKLAPDISPGKTWEGAFGGVLFAAPLGALLAYLFSKYTYMPPDFTPWVAAFIAIPVAVLAIASDLVESVLKRQAGVKDSGNIIPGIGGAFDLADSLLLSASSGFLFFKYILY